MPGPLPLPISLSQNQRSMLKAIVRRHTVSQNIARRAKIILCADNEQNNAEIARSLRIGITTVKIWRKRWHAKAPALPHDDDERLESAMIDLLRDDPRSGHPVTFTAVQRAEVIALACEDPKKCKRSLSHWTNKELAREVVKRRIARRISPATVGRFLKEGRSQAASNAVLAQPRR